MTRRLPLHRFGFNRTVCKAGRLFLFNADNVASDEDQRKDELVVTHIATPPTYRIGKVKNVAAIAYQRVLFLYYTHIYLNSNTKAP